MNPASADGDQRYKGMLLPKQSGKLKVPISQDECTDSIGPRRGRPIFLRNGRRGKRIRTSHRRRHRKSSQKTNQTLLWFKPSPLSYRPPTHTLTHSDLSKDYEALGGAYNAFSLNENGGSLPLAIERVGQASDGTYLSLQELVLGLSATFAEPLAESSQFAEILRSVLKYRRQKALQLELTNDTLAAKTAQLSSLEKSEQEARRIEGALARIEGSQILPQPAQGRQQQGPPASPERSREREGDEPSSPEQEREEEDVMPKGSPRKTKKRLSGVGKVFGFGKLNYAMKGIIDVDPETTRRNNIGKTRESITQVIFPLVKSCGADPFSWNHRCRFWSRMSRLHQSRSDGNWRGINVSRRRI